MTSAVDRHYTPAWLADEMVGLLPSSVGTVVDLAAGGGSLLEAAERRFGESLVVAAADIDPTAVQTLRSQKSGWTVSNADSLSVRSFVASAVYRLLPSGYDAALLNPPFSYRGGRRLVVDYRGTCYRVTPATAFVARALEATTAAGVVVAVLPQNLMNVRGDADLWTRLAGEFELQVVRPLNRYTFRNVRSTSMLVRLDQSRAAVTAFTKASQRAANSVPATRFECPCLEIVRGRVPVHLSKMHIATDGAAFIHSTSIRDGIVSTVVPALDRKLATSGPMVLLPRVGAPNPGKIGVVLSEPVVLSDCVFGLRPTRPEMLETLLELLVENYQSLSAQYSGSCAPYLTIDRLKVWLGARGFDVSLARASDLPGRCNCAVAQAALA